MLEGLFFSEAALLGLWMVFFSLRLHVGFLLSVCLCPNQFTDALILVELESFSKSES